MLDFTCMNGWFLLQVPFFKSIHGLHGTMNLWQISTTLNTCNHQKNKVYTLDTWLRYWKIDGFVWIQSNDWFETCRTMDIRPWARFHTIEKKQSKEQLVLDFWSCFLFARWTLSLFAGHLLNLIQLNNVWLNRAGFQWFHHPYSPKQPGFFVRAWASVWFIVC